MLAAACVAAPVIAALAAFRTHRLLIDATPAAYLLALFGLMAVLALIAFGVLCAGRPSSST